MTAPGERALRRACELRIHGRAERERASMIEPDPMKDRRALRTQKRARSQSRRRTVAVVTVLALAVVTLAALFRQSNASPQPAFQAAAPARHAVDQGAIERGAAIFTANCIACHGTGGRGDGPAAAELDPTPADLTSEMHRAHPDEDYVNWITNGVPDSAMPAFGDT